MPRYTSILKTYENMNPPNLKNIIRTTIYPVILLVTLLSGCSVPEESDINAYQLYTDIPFIHASCDDQSFSGTITGNTDWTVSGMTDWCSVSVERGRGDGNAQEIVVYLTENTKNHTRRTTLYIDGTACRTEIPIIQRGISEQVENVFIMYLMGNNNLSGYLKSNITQAMRAVSNGAAGVDNRIMVFLDTESKTTLEEIEYDHQTRQSVRTLIRDYGNVDCTDPRIMAEAINDIKQDAPARHYAISIGAHGWGWLTSSLGSDRRQRSLNGSGLKWLYDKTTAPCDEYSTRNIGTDGSRWMDISGIKEGLRDIHFDFMMLDACFMGSVEALYELRGTADCIMASPCEIMASGFPYEKVVQTMFASWGDWNSIADCFVDYYAAQPSLGSAYISVIKTSELDALAGRFSKVARQASEPDDTEEIQHYEQLESHIFYDLEDYVRSMNCTDAIALEEFHRQLARTVQHVRHTGKIWSNIYSHGEWITLERACGLSSYIPRQTYPVFRQAYMETEWGRTVYPENM